VYEEAASQAGLGVASLEELVSATAAGIGGSDLIAQAEMGPGWN
jgi:hypothetical protein